jgi:starch phosphorylase
VYAGSDDLRKAAGLLASSLPPSLAPLAKLAYNWRWSWHKGGADVFEAIDPHRWALVGGNPVRLLTSTSRRSIDRAASDIDLIRAVHELAVAVEEDLARPPMTGPSTPERPIAFLCAEFGVHPALPIYSGGLGVLAGDILKAASDLALPMVGVGLMYRVGYFHQRLDTSGFQHEYWLDSDPDRLPATIVTDGDGHPLRVTVPLADHDLVAQVWRTDVGRVPLYLLDTNVPENHVTGRWVTARLYEGNRAVRLAQYGMLGVGGVRALEAMGITPSLYHLNEGHPVLGAFHLIKRELEAGRTLDEARVRVRDRLVFTTHTPVPAGNETYAPDEILAMLGRVGDLVGDHDATLRWGRINPDDANEPAGMTVLAIRSSRSTNGVAARHGEVARAMWQPLYPGTAVDDVPITSVTNGAHVATWLNGPMRDLLDEHLADGWLTRCNQPETWAPVADIPDAAVWAARCEARRRMLDQVRERTTEDRLRRGESLEYARAAEHTLDPEVLTLGFARRIATYKRLHLLAADPARSLALLAGERPVQLLFAGKAHPLDDNAKRILQALFNLKGASGVAGRVAFLEDYDMEIARHLVSGCDVWINVPRPPQEASGTSGMKAGMNGCLNLSVLDGWWPECYDGTNGWAIDGAIDADTEAQDRRHGAALLDLLEQQVIPRFHERDANGVPVAWVQMVKRSLMTVGPQFSAQRMVLDYASRIYRSDP